jgi:predicted nucleotidyltransferase
MREIAEFFEAVKTWAAGRTDILAVGLVGSHARGTALADSDVDLVIITETPHLYLNDATWLNFFGQVIRISDEDWGLLQSRRTFYDDGLEVEFGITTGAWAALDPVDDGTRGVIADGAKAVYDPHGMWAALMAHVQGKTG